MSTGCFAEHTRWMGCLELLLLRSIMIVGLSYHFGWNSLAKEALRLASLLSACLLLTAVFQRGRRTSCLAETS